jgi:hypothetical protein
LKKLLLALLVLLLCTNRLFSQNTLFEESRVSSVYIEIPPDSLVILMDSVLADHYYKTQFVYDYGIGRDTLMDVGFRLRGNTSRFSQKKSFKLSFNEYVSGRRYQGVKKINLNGQHNDPTMIREKLFYDTWKKSGMVERRTSFVKLYINQVYYGLYTNLEELDKDWLQRVYGENAGNLYKCTYPATLAYIGPTQQLYKNIESGSATGGRAYDLQTNEAEDDYSDFVQLVSELNQPANAQFAAQISTLINVDEFLKAFALDVATGNWDDYMYNQNNFFLYHNQNTGKFEFISYDTDNTFGVDWLNKDWATRNCLDWINHNQPRPLAVKLLAIPAFQDKYRHYLDSIARYIILPDSIFPHINLLKELIISAAVEDTFRTLDYGYTIADFNNGFTLTVDDHTPYGIKPFLTTRQASIIRQLPAASVSDLNAAGSQITLFPNPATTQITISSLPSAYSRHIKVADILGRQKELYEWEKNQGSVNIQLGELLPGVYTLIIESQGHTGYAKFIKK